MKNPESGHDLWYSGKHRAHGGNVQVLCDPEGPPVAVSDVQPGSMHGIAAARATGFLGAVHAAAALLGCPALADKGYHGAGIYVHTPATGAHMAAGTALPQPVADWASRRSRTRYRRAQDPVESATPCPAVPAADWCDRRCSSGPDHRRATNPLRTPQCPSENVRLEGCFRDVVPLIAPFSQVTESSRNVPLQYY